MKGFIAANCGTVGAINLIEVGTIRSLGGGMPHHMAHFTKYCCSEYTMVVFDMSIDNHVPKSSIITLRNAGY